MIEVDKTVSVTVEAQTDDAAKKLKQLETQADAVGRSLTNAFKSSIIDGQSLSKVLSNLALSLSDMALNSALAPLEKSISGAVGGLLTQLSPLVSLGSISSVMPTQITPFANGGIVSSPTLFPMSGGSSLGLMGEAGSEAILPLTRGSDGRLGVAAGAPNGAGSAMNITFNVSTPDVEGFARSEAQMTAMLARAVGRGRRLL
jgi:phage-related minor tail protein